LTTTIQLNLGLRDTVRVGADCDEVLTYLLTSRLSSCCCPVSPVLYTDVTARY